MTERKSQSNKLTIVLLSIIAIFLGALLLTQANNSSFFSKLTGQKVVTIPNGTKLNLVLQNSASSATSRRGDIINATITSPITIGEDIAVPYGSNITGEVISVSPAERFKAGKGGYLSVKFNSIQTPNGKKYSISTSPYTLVGETGGSRVAKGVGKAVLGAGVGAALGTAVGAIAGGRPGRGAWSGAAIGGGLGATSAIVSKGKDVGLYSGATVTIVLEQPVQVVAFKP